MVIIVGASVGAVILFLIGVACCFIKSRNKYNGGSEIVPIVDIKIMPTEGSV